MYIQSIHYAKNISSISTILTDQKPVVRAWTTAENSSDLTKIYNVLNEGFESSIHLIISSDLLISFSNPHH